MSKETNIITEVTNPKDRLVRAVTIVKEYRRSAEQNRLAAGSAVAEDVLLENIPTLDFIVDGDLRNDDPQDYSIVDRISNLSAELVTDTQDKIDLLLSIADAAPSINSTRRLTAYLPLALPRTRDGLAALKFIATGYKTNGLLPDTQQLAANIAGTVKQLSSFDNAVITAAKQDEILLQGLTDQAREQARLRLPELIEVDSDQIAEMRSIAAQAKMRVLRRETIQAGGGREYSRYEILANEIIARDQLAQQSDELEQRRTKTLERAKASVSEAVARRRAIKRIVALIDSDPLLRQALAKRKRISEEELLEADLAIKREAARIALNTRTITLSIEDRRVFYGETVIKEERQKLEEDMQDPLLFVSQLSDEELQIIRSGIPKISDRKSIFDLAKDRLTKEIEDMVSYDELLGVLTEQTVRDLLSKRVTMAVDLAIRDAGGVNDSIVTGAIKYLYLNSPPLRLSNVQVEGDQDDPARILGIDQLRCLTEKNITQLLENLAQSPNLYGVKIENREGVKMYMIDQKTKEMLKKMGGFLTDLSKIPDTVILPETEDEMSCLLTMVIEAIATGKPITLVTPMCPDWSRDSQGRYDFKSLGGGESFIAAKFFANAPAILSAFASNGIPFKGMLQFADWGLETEIDAKGTYGEKLSQEDVQMCFASTVATTDRTLKALQEDARLGKLFANYQIVSMKEFIASNIDEKEVKAQMRKFFTSDRQGKKLWEVLAKQSLAINQKRLGLSEEENREFALRNLIEYSTEGQAVGEHSILLVCESRTTSRCYNMPKAKDKKIPIFYVKGQGSIEEGVNIL